MCYVDAEDYELDNRSGSIGGVSIVPSIFSRIRVQDDGSDAT